MSINKLSKAIGFERVSAGQALPLASRAILVVSGAHGGAITVLAPVFRSY